MGRKVNPNQINVYPNYYYYKLTIAYCHVKKLPKSGFGVRLIEEKFNGMSDAEQKKLIDTFDNMTPYQKKYPDKFEEK